ncbi:uncharacterized protein LOC123032501 [Varanus komodoensis]|uniref:uncharacterized protein LOC123032501 n=1 Tax=Varanus komodoensis TaxID=61221 RepID=UPI001CF77E04|nr:uncharacterized protein LOC123032501 [Varanus komodoensis]
MRYLSSVGLQYMLKSPFEILIYLTTSILFLSSVLELHLFSLYRAQEFQFVDKESVARVPCILEDKVEDDGLSFGWYKRRENETLCLVKSCLEKNTVSRFACKTEGQKTVLEISRAQTDDSGLYLCAKTDLTFKFSNVSTLLIVGDSYTPSSSVVFLQLRAPQNNRVACVVHGVSNFVQVSWDSAGPLEQETHLVKNSSGFLTFLSVLHIPGGSHRTLKDIICKVKFNSSHTGVKVKGTFPAASSTGVSANCLNYLVPLAVLSVLAWLMLLVSFLWIRLGPSRPAFRGFWTWFSGPPSSEMPQVLLFSGWKWRVKNVSSF